MVARKTKSDSCGLVGTRFPIPIGVRIGDGHARFICSTCRRRGHLCFRSIPFRPGRSVAPPPSALFNREQRLQMERGGRVLFYPPIYDEIDEFGDLVHRVVFRDGSTQVIELGDPLPQEEAHEQVRELLREGLRDGTYQESDFYLQDPYIYMQQYYIAPDGLGMEEQQDAAYGHGRTGGFPASGEAILGLLETSVKEAGECSVCLMDFETGSKIRMMPCSHYFHEQCIFTWLQLNHVCPLRRFSLPTEQK